MCLRMKIVEITLAGLLVGTFLAVVDDGVVVVVSSEHPQGVLSDGLVSCKYNIN